MKAKIALLAAAAAASVGASQATGAGTARVMHLLDVSESATPAFDAGHGMPRPGDRVFLQDGLYAWKGAKRGARVGRADATLTFTSAFGPHGVAADISGQVYLHGGSLRVEGMGQIVPSEPSRFTLPIVGGTGAYAGARGVLLIRDLSASGDKSAFDIRLLP
jgi:hypothetical protein